MWNQEAEAARDKYEASLPHRLVLVAAGELPAPLVRNGSKDRFGNLRASIGGRPKIVPGIAGPKAFSNRAQPGEAPKRLELKGGAQLKVIQHLKSLQKKYLGSLVGRRMFWTIARRYFLKINRKRMERLLRDERKIQARVHQLGVGAGYGVSNASHGKQVAIHTKKCCSTGARNVGAGRRWPYVEIAADVNI